MAFIRHFFHKCKGKYEVVMNFKEDGMSMQEKALKIIKKDGEISVQK